MPPVARITATSRCFISSCVPSSVTVVIQPMLPAGAPAAAAASRHDLDRARDAARRRRMRAEHDRAARLERDQHLVDRRRRRVRGRHDRGDDAERLGDLDDLLVFDPVDDADGLHRPDELVDLPRREEILLDLVGDDAVAGLLDGQRRQRLGVRRDGRPPSRSTMASICSWESSASSDCACRAARGERACLRDRRRDPCRTAGARSWTAIGRGYDFGRIRSTSACGRGITWTEMSSPTRRAAAAPASVAAFTAPTSPRTSTVT